MATTPTTYKVGDYTVDNSWKLYSNYDKSAGTTINTYFNPTNPTQTFSTNQLIGSSGSIGSRPTQIFANDPSFKSLVDSGLYDTTGKATSKLFQPDGSFMSYEQLQAQKQLDSLNAQMRAGTITPEQKLALEKSQIVDNPAVNTNPADFAAGTALGAASSDPTGGSTNAGKTASYQTQSTDPNGFNYRPDPNAPPPVSPQQTFQAALQSVYSSRPDLQKVYNADGSRRNPNDGNPATLTDWARTFGVNESPIIKQALTQTSSSSTGSAIPKPNGTGATQTTGNVTPVAPSASPSPTDVPAFKDIYSDVYNKLGLTNIKNQYTDYNKQLLDLRNKKADDTAAINANPWLTEGTRLAQIGKLDDKYGQKEANLLAFITLSNNLYQEGVNQAQFLTTGTYNQLETNHEEMIAKQQASLEAAQTIVDQYGVTTQFFNKGGTFYRSSDGKGYSNPQDFFKDAGVSSFQEAVDKGLVTNIDPAKLADKAQVLDLAAKYPDAGISYNDTYAQAVAKLGRSGIYHKDTYIAPSSVQTNDAIATTLALSAGNDGFVDPKTYLQTRSTSKINANEFDNRYAYLLSPAEQKNLGVTSTKPATDVQNSASGYATRIKSAGDILNSLESSISGYNAGGFYAQESLPNNLKSSQIQQYDQAALNFITAQLRRESGAAIAQSEIDNAYKQYLPRPGDSPEVLAQKRQNRQDVYNSLVQAAGPALSGGTNIDTLRSTYNY